MNVKTHTICQKKETDFLKIPFSQDCKSTGLRGSELNLFNVSMSSKGNYTCLVIFRHEDKNYTASLTYHLIVKKKGE